MASSLKDQAYDHVYRKLVGGELTPGTRLSSRALATEIGMSVIPVREAVCQLQSEGFVEHRSGVGSFVPAPSYEELLEIYELRELIESSAADKAAQSMSESDISDLTECVDEAAKLLQQFEQTSRLKRDPQSLAQWSTMDAKFHDTIMLAAGNRRAAEIVRRLRTMSRIFGKRVAFQPLQKFQQASVGHRRILEAVERGDSEEARRSMAEHIRGAWQTLLEFHRRDRLDERSR